MAVIQVWNYNGQLAPVDGAAQIEFYLRGKQIGVPVPRGGSREAAIQLLMDAGEIWEQEWDGPTR